MPRKYASLPLWENCPSAFLYVVFIIFASSKNPKIGMIYKEKASVQKAFSACYQI